MGFLVIDNVRNYDLFLTEGTIMKSLTAHISEVVKNTPEGSVLSLREFLHLGSRAAVDQVFSRLTRQGEVFRLARGLYATPIVSRFGRRPPAPQQLLVALAEKTGEITVPHGASAANSLGLTRQVPLRELYLTSGPSRQLQLGAQTVELRHAPSWQLLLAGTSAGTILRALAWAGPEQAESFLQQMQNSILASEWRKLSTIRSRLPVWLARVVGKASTT